MVLPVIDKLTTFFKQIFLLLVSHLEAKTQRDFWPQDLTISSLYNESTFFSEFHQYNFKELKKVTS